eukprot:jgi/Mesvir1/6035/Mv00776-RA.1
MPSLPWLPSGRVRDAPPSPENAGWTLPSMCKDTSLYQFETDETAANHAPRSSSKLSITMEETGERGRLHGSMGEASHSLSNHGRLSSGHGSDVSASRGSNGSHYTHSHSTNGTGSVPGIWMASGSRSRPPPRPPTSTVSIPPSRGCMSGCCLDLRLWLCPPSVKLPQPQDGAGGRVEASAQSNTLRMLAQAAAANESANASTGSLGSEGSFKGRRDSAGSEKGGVSPAGAPPKRSWRNSFVMRGRRSAQRATAAATTQVAPLGSSERPRPIKVVLVGGRACGKTALFHSYINNTFPSTHESTVQAGLGAKLVVINEGKENEMWAGLQVLDTPPPPAPNAAYISGYVVNLDHHNIWSEVDHGVCYLDSRYLLIN